MSGGIDLATLSVGVDTSGAVQAQNDLDRLVQKAQSAEDAAEGLGTAAKRMSDSFREAAESASRAGASNDEVARAAKQSAVELANQREQIQGVVAEYSTLIAQVGLAGRELEQFQAIRRAGADASTQEGRNLAILAGLYHDVATAAQAAASAEAARRQQAGTQFQQRLNENFGLAKVAGDPSPTYSAQDSAQFFQRQFEEQDRIDQLRRQQAGSQFSEDLNQRFGISGESNDGGVSKSARESAAAFEEADSQAAGYQKRLDAIRASIDPLVAAQMKLARDTQDVGDLFKAGVIDQSDHDAMVRQLTTNYTKLSEGIEKTKARGQGLSPQQYGWLFSNVQDFTNQISAGGSSALTMATMQQVPQILEIMSMGRGGIGGSLTAMKEAVVGMISPLTVVAGGLLSLGAAAAYAYSSFSSSQKEAERATFGVGRRSQVSPGEIEAQGFNNRDIGAGISSSTGISIASTIAATGNIDPSNFQKLNDVVKDYAFTTNQQAVPAAKELADAFGQGMQGIDQLNAKIGFLDSSQREMIQNMILGGDKAGAQSMAIGLLAKNLENASQKTGIFAKAWNYATSGVSSLFTGAGSGVAQIMGTGPLEQQLQDARAELDRLKNAGVGQSGQIGFGAGFDPSIIDNQTKKVSELEKKLGDAKEAGKRVDDAFKSIDADKLVQSMNPLDEQIKRLKGNLNDLVTKRFEWSIPTDKIADTDRAIAGLTRQIQVMTENAQRGGTALADMARNADFQLKTTGFTDFAKQAETIRKETDDAKRKLAEENKNTSFEGLDMLVKQQEALDKIAETRIKALTEQNRLTESNRGGAYNRAPAFVQGEIDRYTQQYGRVSPALAAGLIEHESSFRENARPIDPKTGKRLSTAYGYTQLLDDTADELGVNKYNPSENIKGGIKYLDKMIAQFGNVFTGLAAYYNGPGATKEALEKTGQVLPSGAAYARDILRRSGESGGQSARETDERSDSVNRSIDLQRKGYEDQQKYLDRSNQTLAELTYKRRAESEEMARAGFVSDEAAAKIAKAAKEIAALGQSSAGLKLSRDLDFEREQMGRTPIEAQAYSRVRGAGIDVNSQGGQLLLEQSRYNAQLQQVQGTAQDVWGSISSGILSGAKATDIAISALGRLQAKLLNMAGDEAIAQLMKLISGGQEGTGGGFGSLFGSGGSLAKLFGIGGGGGGGGSVPMAPVDSPSWFDPSGFATGGIMTSKGPAPLRTYSGGGIAFTPQTAVFGEGSMPEAYVPLPDGRSIPVTMDRADTGGAARTVAPSFSASISMQGSSGDPQADSRHAEETARQFQSTMQEMFNSYVANESRPGGSLYRSGSSRSY